MLRQLYHSLQLQHVGIWCYNPINFTNLHFHIDRLETFDEINHSLPNEILYYSFNCVHFKQGVSKVSLAELCFQNFLNGLILLSSGHNPFRYISRLLELLSSEYFENMNWRLEISIKSKANQPVIVIFPLPNKLSHQLFKTPNIGIFFSITMPWMLLYR